MKILRFLLYFTVLAILCGCRTIEYYPLETVRTDTIYVNRLAVDSILVRDSIYIHERGDTVLEHRYHVCPAWATTIGCKSRTSLDSRNR